MTDDLILDVRRAEFGDSPEKTTVDFHLNVPKKPHEDLPSSAAWHDAELHRFELRLGLLSKERYEASEIKEVIYEILEDQMNLSEGKSGLSPRSGMNPKVTYDPHWGEFGFWQVHLSGGFYISEWDEDRFEEFTREFTEKFIEAFEWDEVDDD